MTTPGRIFQRTAARRVEGHRGFLLLDMLIAMGIVAALTVAMCALLSRANRVAKKMIDARTAARDAESVLADLQSSHAPTTAPSQRLTIQPEPGGTAIRGYAWVRITVTVEGESADIVGLVPEGAGKPGTDSPTQPDRPATREGP